MPRCSIVLLEAGIVTLDDKGDIIGSYSFDTGMAKTFREIRAGKPPDDFLSVVELLKSKNCEHVSCNDNALADILSDHGISTSVMDHEEKVGVQDKKIELMIGANFAKNEFEALNILRNFAMNLSSMKVGEVSGKRDSHIIQSVSLLDELDKIINMMGSRVREWYGLHFPELDAMIQNLPTYCDIVLIGSRESVNKEVLIEKQIPEEKAARLEEAAKSSNGGDITAENLLAAQKLAQDIKNLISLRNYLTAHLENEMEDVAPNLKEILGATIGARLIARTGSLDRLATMAASTIQVIGAEKALFRALKTGTRPPKHGILFQHPSIHSAPKWQRGKIARAIAAKAAIAARIDAHRGERSPKLIEDLNKRIEEIREKYREPVERAEEFEEPSYRKEEKRWRKEKKWKKKGKGRDRDKDREKKRRKKKFRKERRRRFGR